MAIPIGRLDYRHVIGMGSKNLMIQLLVVACLVTTLFAMTPTGKATPDGVPLLLWARTYGGMGVDNARAFVNSMDGGYAMVGTTPGVGLGDQDIWLVKTDANGQMEWNKAFGTADAEEGRSVVQTSDGEYAIAGNKYSPDADAWLVKTNKLGEMEWNKAYGGAANDFVGGTAGLIQTSDGGYAIAGETYSYAQDGDGDAWLVKTDANGNMQWNKPYPHGGLEGCYCVIQTNDGGYALACHAGGQPSYAYDFWLVKTDASGNIVWDKMYGGIYRDIPYQVIQTGDGGYAMVGYTATALNHDQFRDAWLVKTDANGNMQWSKTYGGAGPDSAYSIVQTADGGYVLGGDTASFGAGGTDFWLIKVDGYGNMQWNKTYGGTSDDGGEGTSAIQASNGGYVLCGTTYSFGAGNGDFWLVKTEFVTWEYVFKDPCRGTVLKISTDDHYFQFVAPETEFALKQDPNMLVRKCPLFTSITIRYEDQKIRLLSYALDGRFDFCAACLEDKCTGKIYSLIDPPGIE
jgi:hypothetical protein